MTIKIDYFDTLLSAADRGSADAYYGRKANPHYRCFDLEAQCYKHIPVAQNSAEYHAYIKAYTGEDDRKDWGK